jgi:hypothetical protein
MKLKREATYLEKWMHKGKQLREPPRASEAQYNLDYTDDNSAAMEQLNLKVPRGTKQRLKRMGLQEGLSMRRMFKRMLDEYEERHPQKKS